MQIAIPAKNSEKAKLNRAIDHRVMELDDDLLTVRALLEMQLTRNERIAYQKLERIIKLTIEALLNS